MKSKVAVIHCDSYDEEKVIDAVKRGIELIGGISSFIKKNEKILLKPNVLAGDKPERCVTTHPSVLKAVGKLLRGKTGNLFYGDSPGFGKPVNQLRKSGLSSVAEELGLQLADFENGNEVISVDSPFTKKFVIARGVLDSDGIISLAKLKTHQLTRITGAVKNQFGCIPGFLKPEYHVTMQNVHDFSKMLVALTLLIKPRLYIMDGITAMEGNGPRSGDPVKMNVLLFSHDPIALDATACRIIDLEPEYVPTMKPGEEWGLGVYAENSIELVGDPVNGFINRGFSVERKPIPLAGTSRLLNHVKNVLSRRPVIDREKCVRCGICVQTCPVNPKALHWKNEGNESKDLPPTYTYRNCIRCFCCQELCPQKAIYVRTPLIGRLIFR